MQDLLRNRPDRRRPALVLLSLTVLLAAVAPAWADDKSAPPRTPKLREVVEIPEDYVGQILTYQVRITTHQNWIKRSSSGDFFLFVQDSEGSQLPRGGLSPDSTVNLLRFLLPKEDGRKLIDRLSANKMYEARIRFMIDRERAVLGPGWAYLARISLVEIP